MDTTFVSITAICDDKFIKDLTHQESVATLGGGKGLVSCLVHTQENTSTSTTNLRYLRIHSPPHTRI